MTQAIVLSVFVLAIALTLWSVGNMRRFENDYRYVGEVPARSYETTLRFAASENGSLCRVAATPSGLFLLPPQRKRPWWAYGGHLGIMKKSLFIPWTDVDYREKRLLLKECTWFEMPARRIYFYIPRDIGDKVLADAGRKIPVTV